MSAVSIWLPDDVSARLQELAQRTGRSKTGYRVGAIREHIDDIENLYLTEQRLMANRAVESESIALAV